MIDFPPPEYPLNGVIPSEDDPRDWPLIAAVPDAPSIELPPRFVPDGWPVVNQRHSSTCVGQSGALTRTVGEKLVEGIDVRFDGWELYDRCKEQDGRPNAKGTSVRVALQILKARGAKVLDADEVMPITGYVRLEHTVDEFKVAIFTMGHVLTTARWCDEWNNRGLLPGAVMGQPVNVSIGHAFVLIGYDDTLDTPLGQGAFLMHNSFGRYWGRNGTAWLPYALINRLGEGWATFDLDESEPEPTPQPEDTVQLLVEVIPGQVATVTAGPVYHPTTLARVTRLLPAPEAKIVGHTEDGAYYGILVRTARTAGTNPKLLLVPSDRVTNLRIAAPAADAQAGILRAKLEAIAPNVTKALSALAEAHDAATDIDTTVKS